MIKNAVNWIIENREWVFSGIGITTLLGIIEFIRKKFNKNSNKENPITIEQNNTGNNNTQIGIQNNYYGGTKDDK